MIKQELKLFFFDRYKLLSFIVISILLILGIYNYIDNYSNDNNIKSIGIVNYDNEEFITYFLDLFKLSTVSEDFNFFITDSENAKEMVKRDEIVAYLVIPEKFSDSVFSGENLPLTVVGNESDWLQISIIKLGMNTAISYLTTAQAGIYATLDVANKLGASPSEVNDMVMPINLAYGLALLDFEEWFNQRAVSATGENTLIDYYIFSATFFFLMISISLFINTLQEGVNKAILNRYRLSGVKLRNVLLNKIIALYIVVFIYSLPLFLIFGLKNFLVVLLVTSIAILVANITNNSTAIIFVFVTSFITLFISGGIIPVVFLPPIFSILARLTPNYWVININNGILPLVMILIYIVILNGASYFIMDRRLKI